MSPEQSSDFYNAMHSVHTQPGNAYIWAIICHDLTVHKHLDQDPLINSRGLPLGAAGGGPVRRDAVVAMGASLLCGSQTPSIPR